MSIDSKIFDRNYYYNICLGSEEFKKSNGSTLNQKVKNMIDELELKQYMRVLEIGCGRGDTSLYIAKKVNSVVGIDYSKDAIKIASALRTKFSKKIRAKTKFYRMKANKLIKFGDDEFDFVIFIDTWDHLDNKELEETMSEIKRVLKPKGRLFIKTCSNKILLNLTYKYYIYPLNKLITSIDKKIRGVEYESLLKNPRTKEAKIQHINEPNYFYLRKIFKEFMFNGKIKSQTGFLTDDKGIRSKIYNYIVTLYPVSKFFPLSIFFAGTFSVILTNKKKV